ncbi:GNAT family N-acetyltransferase [Xenorhabdus sp. Reich]|uniref:GNAT family N-acetyltransferase n=1 Tax=Xenorhabdus littoralis TaxID=2582835 RepID=A0ABU4SJM5_9GAMM|nr:GNAT family N-acetyltransferase [Xenorhabdus sp. Reich]MDX7998859.1 GNAT family N-acetyltransferase [Xenorhabdus sp. Reich]
MNKENKPTEKDLIRFLNKINHEFTPPLNNKINITLYARKLIEKALFFYTADKEKILSCCAMYANDYNTLTAYLSILAVHPSCRNSGIANKLLLQAENKLKKDNFKKISLEVYKNNKIAIKLYEKNGFKLIFESEFSLYMTKDL